MILRKLIGFLLPSFVTMLFEWVRKLFSLERVGGVRYED
ncbi:hypothetical protein JOD21_000781 [Jeotgalibacillus terrae]|nr:hypothetical protein [Jeotgalibacillus terrae]